MVRSVLHNLQRMHESFFFSSKATIPYLPDDILIRIFTEFSLIEWTTDNLERGRWPWNPAMLYSRHLEKDNATHLKTKLSLSLVSRRFNELTTRLLYEFVRITSIQQMKALDHCLHHLPVLAVKIARYTKRLDIVPTKEPIVRSQNNDFAKLSLQRVRPFHEFAMRIWSACPNITHLTISILQETLPDESILTRAVRLHCSKLQVINWRYGPEIEHLDFLASFGSNLRVFDLSSVAGLRFYYGAPKNVISLQMPHLHTLRGPISIICRDFQHFELPMLRTVIAEHDTVGALYKEENGEAFFSKHGARIRNFITHSPKLGIKLSLLPNLRRLVFRVDDDLLSKAEHRQHNPSLEFVGFLDHLLVEESPPPLERGFTDAMRAQLLACTETIVQQLLRAKQDDFPNLKCVQFIGEKLNSFTLNVDRVPLPPAVWDIIGAGLEIKDSKGNSVLDRVAAKKKDKENSPAKASSPAKAKHAWKRRVPRFAKEYPKLNASELNVPSDATDAALVKKFDFSLNLESINKDHGSAS